MHRYYGPGLRIIGFVFLLMGALWQMLFAYQEQQSFIEKFDKSRTPQARNFKGLTYQAKQAHMLEADLATGKALLQQALTVNPSYVPAWLSFAELYNDLGEKDKANVVLLYVDGLTQGLKRWRWEKALTAYQLGKFEMLPDELSFIIRELSGKSRNDALQLAFSLWESPAEILEKLGMVNINHLLSFAVKTNQVAKSMFFWQRMASEGVPWQHKEGLDLVDMLLRQGEVSKASAIWRTYFNPDKTLFNGDFSTPFLEKAFGWRTVKKQNFDYFFEKSLDGNPANILHYRFKGWDNINFNHLYQIVPVMGGREYTLTARMKSEKMTTDQRPFLEIAGFRCTFPAASSEMVAADQDWTEHQVVVQVPEACGAVVVRLRRKESSYIDNKLAGQLWLRQLEMLPAAENLPEKEAGDATPPGQMKLGNLIISPANEDFLPHPSVSRK